MTKNWEEYETIVKKSLEAGGVIAQTVEKKVLQTLGITKKL